MEPTKEFIDRFWSRVQKDDGCWRWMGAHDTGGYGVVKLDGKTLRAHRVSYAINKGPLIDGLVIDHTCSNRECVNPQHLEQVTQQQNMARANLPGPIGQTWTWPNIGADGLSECGTAGSYKRGCRCTECKAWQANRVREYRTRLKQAA